MNFRNATYNAVGAIDCEIEHPAYGWIPFTASSDDVEPLGREVFQSAKDIAGPYVSPDPAEQLAEWRATASLPKADFCIGLNHRGVLSKADMKLASRGGWPEAFTAALANLPIDPDEAEVIWAAATNVARLHPVLVALIPESTLTEEDVDIMFGWTG